MSKRLIFIFLALLLLASGPSCLGSSPAPMAELAILNQELTKDATGATVLYVTVKNTSHAVAELAEVTVDFFDADNNLVDSSRDSVLNLQPNETWDFTFRCEAARCSEVTRADIKATAGTSSGRL